MQELPRINFIQKCRTILRIIRDTLVAYHIGKVEQWEQLFSEGTVMRKIYIHNLFIGVIYDKRLRPLILSTSIILEVETSDQ